ncbi:MAG TPA: hypothetical protein VIL26_00975, partial [Clostridia bacterium]
FISIFYMLSDLFNDFYITYPFEKTFEALFRLINIDQNYSEGVTRGLIEVTNGCINICQNKSNIIINTVLCGFLISWGGLSIHMQNLTFLTNAKVKISFYFLSKTVQSIVMIIITAVLCMMFL